MSAFNLSAKQVDLLIGYVKECDGTVDWNKVAATANYSSGKYARDQFAVVRKKLFDAAPGAGDDAPAAAAATPNGKTKAKATPRKRKNASDADDEETPKQTKKAKGAAKKGDDAVVKDEPNEAGEMMDELN